MSLLGELREVRRLTGYTGLRSGPDRAAVQAARASALEWHEDAFQAAIGDLSRRIPGRAAALIGTVAVDLEADARERTPFKTGHARSGWSVDTSGLHGDEPHAHVENFAAPYVVMLEFGWSQQAPEGMLRPAMRKIKHELRRRLRRLLD